jgi:putative tricarboxylic transport membrane protein
MRGSKAWKEILEKQDWTDIFLAGDPYKTYIETETKRIGEILTDLGLAKS